MAIVTLAFIVPSSTAGNGKRIRALQGNPATSSVAPDTSTTATERLTTPTLLACVGSTGVACNLLNVSGKQAKVRVNLMANATVLETTGWTTIEDGYIGAVWQTGGEVFTPMYCSMEIADGGRKEDFRGAIYVFPWPGGADITALSAT